MKKIVETKIHILELLSKNFDKKLFSGVSSAVFSYPDKFKFINLGGTSFLKDSYKVDKTTLFDLASLTKPFTALCILSLVAQKEISLDDKISRFFNNIKLDISIWMLLCHASGLKAYTDIGKLLDKDIDKNSILKRASYKILKTQILYPPLKKQIYSDLGYIVLSSIIENICKNSFDICMNELVLNPLGLKDIYFFPNIPKDSLVAISLKDIDTPNVNDPNARFLGSISGHAGLFGSSKEIAKFLQKLFLIYLGELEIKYFPQRLLKKFFMPPLPQLGTWALGFDTKSPKGSSAGESFSEKSIGHLGFTGTSFWLDLKNGIGVSVLTNRTISPLIDSQERMKKLRPKIHSLLWEIGKEL